MENLVQATVIEILKKDTLFGNGGNSIMDGGCVNLMVPAPGITQYTYKHTNIYSIYMYEFACIYLHTNTLTQIHHY